MGAHDYGLAWLNQDELFKVTCHVFEKSINPSKRKPLPLDPFAAVIQSKITDSTMAEVLSFDVLRAQNKTLQNAIGLWHQEVLSLAPNWETLGANGGGLDLKTIPGYLSPTHGKPLYAEVKNRFNTIKAVDEKPLWEKMDIVARSNGAIAYLIQIIPKTSEKYDKPWAPSNVAPRDHVRVCDGVTGYAMVFNHDNALRELYDALPALLDDVLLEYGCSLGIAIDEELMRDSYNEVFPNP